MFQPDRVIALDIGASKLVVAEFGVGKPQGLELLNYGVGQLGFEHEGRADSSAFIVSTIRDVMRENGIEPAPLLMTVSGQAVFPRFVKLPPVTTDKIAQIVRYEAEQNVPFPIEEVVWDYQLIGGDEGDMNVMLVAVKVENIQSLTDCVAAAGMEPEIVDAAPMALYNCVRYNYPGLEGCTMVLDVGARSSNLIFVEGARIFSRSIPVAGNAITQEIAKEFDISFEEAENLKRTHAFVAFGGVYGGPDSEVADKVSKIVRNVMTRLHAEANRSINFYRSQHGGSQPSLLLLTGGSSVIPHTDTFFRERLKVEVEYLNPFANVPVSDQLDAERIGNDLHLMGEVVGLGLRRALACPIEINLMPPNLVARKTFRKRQPFFALAAVGLVLVMFCWWVYAKKMGDARSKEIAEVEHRIQQLSSLDGQLTKVIGERKVAQQKADDAADVAMRRTRWLEILQSVHHSLLDGMWITSVTPKLVDGKVVSVEITGCGFEDKMREIQKDSKGLTPSEVFRNRLIESPVFGDKTKITANPPPDPDAYARTFAIELVLEKPIVR
jgi:type IV pilus assembly protein PilM